jgi:hypothetical protein
LSYNHGDGLYDFQYLDNSSANKVTANAANGKNYTYVWYVKDAGALTQSRVKIDQDGYDTSTEVAYSWFQVDPSVKVNCADDDATYYVVFKTASSTGYLDTVAYAIDDETISENSVAVTYELYKLETSSTDKAADGGYHKYLTRKYTTVDGVTITLDADDFSRTNLKAESAISVLQVSLDSYTKDKNTLYRLRSVGAENSEGKVVINLPSLDSSLLIFDGLAVEESNNDGVSDTDTTAATTAAASTTAATSPKTGDVAPIAALAVVMMGACGALVVASKKRA